MTTTVSIKHEGPDHHDVEVKVTSPNESVSRLSSGDTLKVTVWQGVEISIKEVEKLKG